MSPNHKSPNSPEGENELASTARELQQGLEQLEKLVPAFTPSLQWFEKQVAEEKRRLRRRLVRDLALFWLIALLLLSISYVVITNKPAVFAITQALVLVAPIVWLAGKKQVKPE